MDAQNIKKKFTLEFDKDRLICVLRYGPQLSLGGLEPDDRDYLVLLNSRNNHDYEKILRIKKLLPKSEIFLEYRDYIESKELTNYQRGCHGSYFLRILADSECVVGYNYFQNKTNNLDRNKNINELFFRIEEYFYRIQKDTLNEDGVLNINKIKKSILRLLTDMMIITGDLTFSDMHKVHHSDILELSVRKNLLGKKELFKKIKKVFAAKELSVYEINSIVDKLSDINIDLYSKIKNGSN